MPDIAMCKNRDCPLVKKCYRYMAVPNQYRQTYGSFKGGKNCDRFWPLSEASTEVREV